MPYHNEGSAFIEEVVKQIHSTIDIDQWEIIIVDNGSDIPLEISAQQVRVIRHETNFGVGAAFDTGVKNALYENLIIMGCDIRFIENQWASKMLTHIESFPKSFIASVCIGLNRYSRCCNEDIDNGLCVKCRKPAENNMDLPYRRNKMKLNGATILMFHDQKSNPKVSESFRGIIEAKWLPGDTKQEGYEIPCILGAFYGVKKAWYNYIDGWAGHQKWGTLEPMISLKSWLMGGTCRMAPDVETGHIFKKYGTHSTPQDVLLYNKMMVATLLFDDFNRMIKFLGTNPIVERAHKLYLDNITWIMEKRNEYRDKIVMKPEDYFERFGIDYRLNKPAPQITPDYIREECNNIYANEKYSYSKHYSESPYINVWKKISEYINPGERVVDIGCGVGQVMDMMLDKGAGRYTGFDISPIAISKACERLAKRKDQNKASLICSNIFDWERVPAADKYILAEILEHITNDREMLEKVPSGSDVVITVPSFMGGSHVRKFDSEEEVKARYAGTIDCKAIDTIQYGTGRIYVMNGVRV